jgi:protein gp37
MAVDAGDPSMEGSLYQDEEWEQTTPRIDWLIVGGESGPGARPFDVAWARSAVRQCREAGVPCFFKQGGLSNRCEHSAKGGHFDCFPPDLKVREFPA